MEDITADMDRSNATVAVKRAFETTDGIKTYHEDGSQIVGKTGWQLSSYGESVIVQLQPTNNGTQTRIVVHSEKDVSFNITANPDRYESRFSVELNRVLNDGFDETFDHNKEVHHERKQAGNTTGLILTIILTVLLIGFMMILPFLIFPF